MLDTDDARTDNASTDDDNNTRTDNASTDDDNDTDRDQFHYRRSVFSSLTVQVQGRQQPCQDCYT
jgi:hypothetical protein